MHRLTFETDEVGLFAACSCGWESEHTGKVEAYVAWTDHELEAS